MSTKAHGHSAKVAITLICGTRRVAVAQVGNSGLLVRQLDAAIPPGEAVLVVDIDGKKKRKHIVLPEGVVEANRFTRFF